MLFFGIDSFRRINYRLYFSLLFLGLCPAIYTAVRIFFVGQLPGEWAYSIAGQLSWVNLLYEVLYEAIILPLFFFIGQVVGDRVHFADRLKSGLVLTAGIYTLFSMLVICFTEPLLSWMAVDPGILAKSTVYIRIESVANIFSVLCAFTLVALVTLGKHHAVYLLTFLRLGLCIVFDTFLVSSLPVSLKLGVYGIGYSNIIVNIFILAVSTLLLVRYRIPIFSKRGFSFRWMREFFKVGGASGLESLVRNLAYMVMISRMVNVVGEQGVYWVANSFIWGWLLLPVNQLGELIKQEVSTDPGAVRTHTAGYLGITALICSSWFLTIPFWKPFMTHVLGYTDVNSLFRLVLLLVGFYVAYAFQNVFQATFYGLGKTNYILFKSVVINMAYYGGAFILYTLHMWGPTLNGIALLFGFGMVLEGLFSLGVYLYLIKNWLPVRLRSNSLPNPERVCQAG